MQFPWAFLINGLELDMELNDEMENGTVNVTCGHITTTVASKNDMQVW